MKTYNWEGVNPDGYFLDKLEPIPSGLTPSQLYDFMPPNLGGFFMVRSFFFFQAEDGIRDYKVTGVQTCALPIFHRSRLTERCWWWTVRSVDFDEDALAGALLGGLDRGLFHAGRDVREPLGAARVAEDQIGRASCRERV